MASHSPAQARNVLLARPGFEWALLLGVVLLLVLLFLRQVRQVQGQSELAAITGTVGSLRTAFVLTHLKILSSPAPGEPALAQRNPFQLLERLPANYLGEVRASQAASIEPGSWIFDPDCVCVGYRPLYAQWLTSPTQDSMIWLAVSAPPAPFSLNFREAYRWRGVAIEDARLRQAQPERT